MSKTGLILFHGFFEHKERHRLNKEWFEKLGIESHLVDLTSLNRYVNFHHSALNLAQISSMKKKQIMRCKAIFLETYPNCSQVYL